GFADQMASAVSNARLHQSVRSLAARLEAIQELAIRLNRTSDLEEIAAVIIEGTERLIVADSIRVYHVDHENGTRDILDQQVSIGGTATPDPAALGVRIGEGITGWVAAHNEPVLLADVASHPRPLARAVHAGAEAT